MNAFSVMCAELPDETSEYRKAVRQIIDDIEREHDLNHIQLAESIDVSLGTISNAHNKKSDLCATFLMRLGRRYGAGFLNPYFRLMDAQASPLDGSLTADILPLVMAVGMKIAKARDPQGPGGSIEVPQEKAEYLPDLKKLQTRSAHLVKEIEAAL